MQRCVKGFPCQYPLTLKNRPHDGHLDKPCERPTTAHNVNHVRPISVSAQFGSCTTSRNKARGKNPNHIPHCQARKRRILWSPASTLSLSGISSIFLLAKGPLDRQCEAPDAGIPVSGPSGCSGARSGARQPRRTAGQAALSGDAKRRPNKTVDTRVYRLTVIKRSPRQK